MRHTGSYLKNSLLILVVLLSFSCKTTKKTINSSTTNTQTEEVVDVKTTTTTTTNEDLTEVITEKIVETNHVVTDSQNKTITTPIKTTERKIERFNTIRKVEDGQILLQQNTSQLIVKDTASYDRETVGQEVVKDITKGFTEGIFKSLFGNAFRYILGGVVVFVCILLLIFVPKKVKDVPSDQRGKEEGL